MSFPNSVEAEAVQTLPNGVSVKVKKRAEYVSNISWEDSWQNAYALAKEAAEAELKNILAKIENDNMTIVELVGPQGPRGFKGQTGKSYKTPTIDASSVTLQLSDTAMEALAAMARGDPPSSVEQLSYNDTISFSKDFETLCSSSEVTSWSESTTKINPSNDFGNNLDQMLRSNLQNYLNMILSSTMKITSITSTNSVSDTTKDIDTKAQGYLIKLVLADIFIKIMVEARRYAFGS